MARLLVVLGFLLVLFGVLLQVAPELLNWFGRLPGDIRYESGNTRVHVPITSMILLSVALTVLVNVVRRLF